MRRIFFIALACIVGEAHAQRLSPLAPVPDWSELEAFQETITRAEFTRLLDEIYAPQQAAAGLVEIGEELLQRFDTAEESAPGFVEAREELGHAGQAREM